MAVNIEPAINNYIKYGKDIHLGKQKAAASLFRCWALHHWLQHLRHDLRISYAQPASWSFFGFSVWGWNLGSDIWVQ